MGGSVGKPTLCVDETSALSKLIQINFSAWFQAGDCTSQCEIVPRAHQCGDPFLPLRAIYGN